MDSNHVMDTDPLPVSAPQAPPPTQVSAMGSMTAVTEVAVPVEANMVPVHSPLPSTHEDAPPPTNRVYRIRNPKTNTIEHNPDAPRIRAYRIRNPKTNVVEHNPHAPRLRGRRARKSDFLRFVYTLSQYKDKDPQWVQEYGRLFELMQEAYMTCSGCGAKFSELLVFYHPEVCLNGPLVLTLQHKVAVQQMSRVDASIAPSSCSRALKIFPQTTRFTLEGNPDGPKLLCSKDRAKAMFDEMVSEQAKQKT